MSADTNDISRQADGGPRAPVRLSVTKINTRDLARPSTLLLDVIEQDSQVAIEQATAWAHVAGTTQLVPLIKSAFSKEPPESGFSALINKTHGLLILFAWPWAPPPL